MKRDRHDSTAAASYASAHATHYRSKDLRQALGLYEGLLAAHPESVEAGYSRSQIQNIARVVVPESERLAAEVALALTHLAEREEP